MITRGWHRGMQMVAGAVVGLLVTQASAVAEKVEKVEKADTGTYNGSLTLGAGGYNVTGNQSLFREQNWTQQGLGYGIENLTYKNDKVELEGRGMPENHDYKLTLTLRPTANIFIRGGAENYRKYFDGLGGYFQGTGLRGSDDQLALDMSKYFVEIGSKFEDSPNFLLGYEYDRKKGMKSSLEMNSVTVGGAAHKIYPAVRDINEHRHALRLDLTADVKEIEIVNKARIEWYQLDNTRNQEIPTGTLGSVKPVGSEYTEGVKNRTFSDSITLEKWVTEKLLLSGGYMYAHSDSETSFKADSYPYWNWIQGYLATNGNLNGQGALVSNGSARGTSFATAFSKPRSDTHNFGVSSLVGPYSGLTLSGGLEYERATTEIPSVQYATTAMAGTGANAANGYIRNPYIWFKENESVDRFRENVELRLDSIPNTSIYARVAFTQESTVLDRDDYRDNNALTPIFANPATQSNAYAATGWSLRDFFDRMNERQYRAGFTNSPCSVATISSYVQRTRRTVDSSANMSGVSLAPTALSSLDSTTDEFMGKLTLRPTRWLRTSLKYQHIQGEIQNNVLQTVAPLYTMTDSADMTADVYSLDVQVMPVERLTLTGTLVWQNVNMMSPDLNAPQIVEDYNGDVYTVMLGAQYELTKKTTLDLGATYSRAFNSQEQAQAYSTNTSMQTVSAGISHKFTEKVSGTLQYQYLQESNADYATGAEDYQAHGVFTTMTMKF